MNDFVLDILQDLRNRRLLPVAILLAIGIVAIPVVMAKPAEEPPAPLPIATQQADPIEDTALKLDVSDAESSAKGSALDVLVDRNPFKPPSSVTATSAQASAAEAGATAGGDAGKGGGGGTPADGGSGGGQTPSAPDPVPVQTVEYEYVADVTFWNGDRRRDRRLHKLDMLPDDSAPVLIFMGATGNGGNAVFLVDSSLSATGEGDCQPSGSNCTFVHIGPGSEHLFTTEEGASYRLRVNEIRRVKLRASTSGASRKSARTAVGSSASQRRFALPSLVDLVQETGPVSTPSSSANDGR